MGGYEIGGEDVDPFNQAALASAAKRRLASMRPARGLEEDSAMNTAGSIAGGALSGAGTGAAIGNIVPIVGPAVGAGIGALLGGLSGYAKKK